MLKTDVEVPLSGEQPQDDSRIAGRMHTAWQKRGARLDRCVLDLGVPLARQSGVVLQERSCDEETSPSLVMNQTGVGGWVLYPKLVSYGGSLEPPADNAHD